MAKKKKVKNKFKKKGGIKIGFRGLVLFLIIVVISMLYLPSAILFFVGMLPTFAAYLTDRIPGKNKTFTIGALNFSGCFYYLIKIWSNSNPMEAAVSYLSDPVTIIVIYVAAGLGYILNYVATIMVSSVLRQKSRIRLDTLEDKKKKLEERWGEKVNGDRPLDAQGFLIDDSSDSVEDS